MNVQEIDQILKVLATPFRQFYQFAFYSGLRTGELIAIRWRDVDLKRNCLNIRVNKTGGIEKEPKTKGSIRDIELHNVAKSALLEILNSQYYHEHRVFIDPSTMLEYKYADRLRKYVWKPALEKAAIRYRSPYHTRHTYASMMLSSGKNPMWVAKQMGHADWGMLRKVYGRWIDND